MGIVFVKQLITQLHQLDSHKLQAFVFETTCYSAYETALYRIRLY